MHATVKQHKLPLEHKEKWSILINIGAKLTFSKNTGCGNDNDDNDFDKDVRSRRKPDPNLG